MTIDRVYTSVLHRAIETARIALEAARRTDLPLIRDQALNERHYGDLQGLNKAETIEKYGPEQVHIWRRSFDVLPPGDEAESLKTCMERVLPYYQQHIAPDLMAGLDVLVVAHGNSLRSLIYMLEHHTIETIMGVEIPTGVPIVYQMEVDGGELRVAGKRAL